MSHLVYSVLTAFVFLMTPFCVEARWATPDDMNYVVNFEKTSAKVKKNGSYSGIVESQLEILKESARQDQGMTRIAFNEKAGKIKILEARTINGKKTIPVSKSNIEIKPLASSGDGFDSLSQISIAYPDVNIGSKLYLKYEYSVDQPNMPGLFFSITTPGLREYVQHFESTFESEVPLYHEIHDPQQAFEVIGGGKKLTFRMKKPLLIAAMEEDNSLFVPESLTWLGVSTAADYSDFPKKTIMKYEDAMSAALPGKFADILAGAKEKTNEIEQINFITSSLAEAVRYVGDWRMVEGAFHPHSLAFIAAKGYGDCKDFTVSTGAILKRLGYEVHAAWVSRGTDLVFTPLKIAAANVNHAILYAKKNGQVYWIDPTNPTSFAQGIYQDIEDRPAIVLFPEGAKRLQTPATSEKDTGVFVKINLHFNKEGVISGKGEMTLQGRSAIGMTGEQLSYDKKTIDYSLLRWATNRSNITNWEFADYNLKSRIVKDLTTSFKFQEPWIPMMTSSGKGYSIPALNGVAAFHSKSQERVTALNLDYPISSKMEYAITGLKVDLPHEIKCDGTSQWVDYSRRMFKNNGAVHVADNLIVKVRTIPPAVVASKEFDSFQDQLVSCMQNAVIVFQ